MRSRSARRRWKHSGGLALLLAAGLASIPAATPAVIIASGDGSGNTEPPADDPGFRNVGDAGRTAVYVGNGWVLSANHALISDVVLAGVSYRAIPGSRVQLENPDNPLRPDLAMLKLQSLPDLPTLPIRNVPPEHGDTVILIGTGRNRGEPFEYHGHGGWRWGDTVAMPSWSAAQVNLESRGLLGTDVGAGAVELAGERSVLVDTGDRAGVYHRAAR